MEQVIVIGAGPCGLSAAIELQRSGFDPLLVEKYNVAHSIYLYPTYLRFFSTPELLEIGGVPFATPNEKPTRQDALQYYRTVAERSGVRIRNYCEVTSISRLPEGGFRLGIESANGNNTPLDTKAVVVATGYFDSPNRLGIPGEDLPKVTHYYKEAHPYAFTDVAVIGGNNSAVDASLDLMRAGARVTMIYRGTPEKQNIKPWVRPIFESMVEKGRLRVLYESQVVRIEPAHIVVRGKDGETFEIGNDFVLALTGFRPDRRMLTDLGVIVDPVTTVPAHDPETMETNVPNLYIAGVIAAGTDANEIFIENGRWHGAAIAAHMSAKRRSAGSDAIEK
ncbi:YpdA family putative bacillithiol disulfide reductase [Paenibacillus thermoaerophilus]|uniref:YpdA family putative bacillithiol disulfide reductase n=1 Tax=Paenibacillus thermoaerophilus TaxID=1215385 RepID=A0ABW2V669_9BACL|nr:YpdA family putative bacillithiol disulfide reductase [Paenibacillus thermoaerophilus]TMV17172.1 YpdA family putative bacillithiol disulfide reductase [Paenibacillus thermoaerophilus]